MTLDFLIECFVDYGGRHVCVLCIKNNYLDGWHAVLSFETAHADVPFGSIVRGDRWDPASNIAVAGVTGRVRVAPPCRAGGCLLAQLIALRSSEVMVGPVTILHLIHH